MINKKIKIKQKNEVKILVNPYESSKLFFWNKMGANSRL